MDGCDRGGRKWIECVLQPLGVPMPAKNVQPRLSPGFA